MRSKCFSGPLFANYQSTRDPRMHKFSIALLAKINCKPQEWGLVPGGNAETASLIPGPG